MEPIFQFLTFLVPALLVLYVAYLLVRSFINKELEMRKLEIRGRSIETILPTRLQAFERMALFLERMSPQNLLIRLNTGPMPAREFHQLLLSEIRNEYNHNVSQQIYMSEELWNLIKSAREDLTVMINESANEMSPEATGLDLSKRIFEKTITKNIDPIAHALIELKREIQRTF
jgi:hypothetical protein